METPTDTPTASHAASGISWEKLKKRLISSLIMVTVVIVAVTAGGIAFTLLVVLAALIMIREWDGIVEGWDARWKLAGLAYVGIPCASLLWLRGLETAENAHAGLSLVFYLVFVIAATDIGAYFTGSKLGGPKVAPAISPNKTWAGLLGGMAGAALIGGICAAFTPYPTTFGGSLWLGAVMALVAQAGDFFESWLKRRAGVKDSGALIPGHGGLLDRVDGYTTAAPFFALLVLMSGLFH